MAYPLAASLSPIIQREMEGHMWRPINIPIAVTSLQDAMLMGAVLLLLAGIISLWFFV